MNVKATLDQLFKKKAIEKSGIKHQDAKKEDDPTATQAELTKEEISDLKKKKLEKKMKKLRKIQEQQMAEERQKERQNDKKKQQNKFTEDGLKIYSMEDLNIGKGGDSADCPFDCNCCF
eukprot:403364007